jgi:hypothetical protein
MRSRLAIGFLIVANVLLGGYVFARRYIFAAPILVPVAQSHTLPLIELQDEKGNVFRTDRFIGSPLFVQFVNPSVEAQLASVVNVREHRPRKPISWLLLTANASELRARLPAGSDDIVIVERDHDMLRDLFSIPKCCEHWVIFDENGSYRDSGNYDTGEAMNRLRSVVDNERVFSPDLLLEIVNSMNEKGQLSQFHESAARSHSGKVVVGMFSMACTGCPDGSLIDTLNKWSAQDHKNNYLIVLPSSFSTNDLKNFKTNLELSIPVQLANADFTHQWLALNEQYGEKAVNGSVFVVDKEKVVSVVSGLSETRRLLRNLTEQK